MVIIGTLGASIAFVLLSNAIKTSDSDQNQKSELEGVEDFSRDPRDFIPNPFMFAMKMLILGVAIMFIALSWVIQTHVVTYEGNFSQAALKDNVTQLLGLGYTTTIWTGFILMGMLLIMLIIIILVWAGKVAKEGTKFSGKPKKLF